MPTHHPHTHRGLAVLAALLIGLLTLPGAASARPADDSAGPRSHLVEPLAPTPTVLRTVIREEAVRALPIALAGAALLISIGGTGLALVRINPLRQQLR
jgi:hypothetical protein